MGTLSDIVSVQIALNTAAVQRGTFGIAMIAAPLTSFSELVRSYTSYDATKNDNLPPQVLVALSDAFAQTPHPTTVKVGRLTAASAIITPIDAVAGAVYSLKLGTTTVSVTAAATPTTSTIATQLAAAINTAALGVTATATAANVSLVNTGTVVPVTTFSRIQWGAITPGAGSLAADLTAIASADKAWYVLHMVERTKQRILDAAAWVEANEKLFITATADADVLVPGTTTDVVSTLQATQYFRTAIIYASNAATEYPDVAWASRVLPIQPGAETWALKRIASVTADNLSATQSTTIYTKGGNTIDTYAPALALTRNGKVAAGEYIDVIRFRDWLKDLIQTNMVQMLVNRDKLPYTDAGINVAHTNMKGSLRTGQNVGGIAPDELKADGSQNPGFVTFAPLAADVDDVTKAARTLYLTFNARIAGAIHLINITGSLSYSLT